MAADVGEDYNMAIMLLAEERKGSFDKVDGGKEDDFELFAHEVERGDGGGEFLDCTNDG